MKNNRKYIIKAVFTFGILLCTAGIKSFDDLQHARRLFEEESALLYNADSVPALSDRETGQFGLPLEPWDNPFVENLLEQSTPDPSILAPSTSSEYNAQPFNDVFLPQCTELTHIALQKSASSILRAQRKSPKKEFICNHPGCDYVTDRSSNLQRHSRIHTGEKPYTCDQPGCSYATGDKSAMVTHKRRHTGVKPYRCHYPGCTFATVYITCLNTHKQNKHSAIAGHESFEKTESTNKKQRLS